MNIDALCAAVWEAERWMKQFNRKEYRGAFRRYGAKFAPLYVQAVQEAEDREGLQALADDMLDALERRWKRRWLGRGALMVDERQMIVSFLSPMLLEQPDARCGRLAGMLRQRWADRWPKLEYRITTYEVLCTGFRTSILGIDVTGSPLDPNRKEHGGT